MKTIFITGEAGSGKTMLLRAIAKLFYEDSALDSKTCELLELYQYDAIRLAEFFKLKKLGKYFLAAYNSDRTESLGRESHNFDKSASKNFILGKKTSYFDHEAGWLFHTRVQNFYAELGKSSTPARRPLHSECFELIKKATQHNRSTTGISDIILKEEDHDYRYRQGMGEYLKFSQLSSTLRDNITLLGDIAARLQIEYKEPDFATVKGLVLIDDICSSGTIGATMGYIKFLEATFPNIQFVVTTSKLMLSSDYDLDQDGDTNSFVRSLGIATTTFVLVNYADGCAPSMFCCDKYTSDFHF